MWYETSLTLARGERDRADGWWRDRLLNDDLDAAARRHPDRDAIVDTRGRTTWGALREQADYAALGLLARGVRRGDIVLAQLPARTEFAVLTLALERIGAAICPVAPNTPAEELRAMLSVSRAAIAVFPARFRGIDLTPIYRDLGKEVPSLRTLVAIDGVSGDGVLSWRDLLAEDAGAGKESAVLNRLRPSPDDVCQLFLARDAHGELRGTLHTANTLGAAVEAVIRAQRLTSADRIHSAASLTHQLGFLLGVRLPIRLGTVAVLQDTWEPDAFLRLVEEQRISVTFGGRPVLAGVLDVLERGANDIGPLRLFGVSGVPLPVALAQQAVRRLPGRVSPLWGSTEAGIVTGVLPGAPAEKVIATAGCPYPPMEVVARDGDGTTLPPDAEGALWVRGASLFAGYIQGRRFTEQFVDAEGWFNTGTRGVLDVDGYVSVCAPTAVT